MARFSFYAPTLGSNLSGVSSSSTTPTRPRFTYTSQAPAGRSSLLQSPSAGTSSLNPLGLFGAGAGFGGSLLSLTQPTPAGGDGTLSGQTQTIGAGLDTLGSVLAGNVGMFDPASFLSMGRYGPTLGIPGGRVGPQVDLSTGTLSLLGGPTGGLIARILGLAGVPTRMGLGTLLSAATGSPIMNPLMPIGILKSAVSIINALNAFTGSPYGSLLGKNTAFTLAQDAKLAASAQNNPALMKFLEANAPQVLANVESLQALNTAMTSLQSAPPGSYVSLTPNAAQAALSLGLTQNVYSTGTGYVMRNMTQHEINAQDPSFQQAIATLTKVVRTSFIEGLSGIEPDININIPTDITADIEAGVAPTIGIPSDITAGIEAGVDAGGDSGGNGSGDGTW